MAICCECHSTIQDDYRGACVTCLRREIDRIKVEAPAWHDRPTGPGWWIWITGYTDEQLLGGYLTKNDIECGKPRRVKKVFGPIPLKRPRRNLWSE
jgi:hypothetical protein